MKKLYALACAAFICTFVNAQVKKGDILLGGNLGYSNQNTQTFNGAGTASTSSNRSLSIAPSFGKAVKDNLVLGFDIAYTNSRSDATGTTSENGNGFSAGAFVRKYWPLGSGFYLFGQSRLGGSYSHASQAVPSGSQPAGDNINNTFGVSLQFIPGIAYALNPKWQLEASLPGLLAISYFHSKQTYNTNQPDQYFTSRGFSLQSDLTGTTALSVGLRYFIGN
jgi:hypothetical protein